MEEEREETGEEQGDVADTVRGSAKMGVGLGGGGLHACVLSGFLAQSPSTCDQSNKL
jgi:hypothetical protein